tara:strand:+ start:1177 stop:1377 length:201 start_codon:yes stop_codon:yes gene_type:complete
MVKENHLKGKFVKKGSLLNVRLNTTGNTNKNTFLCNNRRSLNPYLGNAQQKKKNNLLVAEKFRAIF